MIICVDAETKLLTPTAIIMAENVVAGEMLLSNNLRAIRVQCVTECEGDCGKEKCGVITCSEHTTNSGSVCKNMPYDPYILGYVVVNHLIVGESIIIPEEHPPVLNYLEEQNLITERNGLFGVTVDSNYFAEYDFANLKPDELRLCSNEYIRCLLGGMLDAMGSYYRGVTTLHMSDEYYHLYDLIHYILVRLNLKYMEVAQEIVFSTLSKSSLNYYTIHIQNMASSVPTKRFDYIYTENIPPTRTVTGRRLISLHLSEPILTNTLTVLSPQ